jgi:hypothetical protein
MRTILIACLALALLVASVTASMQYHDVQSQDDVKNNRWNNCSAVVHGRLGDLHQYGNESWKIVRQSGDFFFAYSPCNPKSYDELITVGRGGLNQGWETVDFTRLRPANVDNKVPSFFWVLLKKVGTDKGWDVSASFQTAAPTDYATTSKLVDFHMPAQKGDVPHFTAEFPIKAVKVETNAVPHLAGSLTVTVNCGLDDSLFLVNITSANHNHEILLQSKEACARFPYTNKAMPNGGIAALIVIIVCFVIQFSICGWYHSTHKLDANPADRQYSDM